MEWQRKVTYNKRVADGIRLGIPGVCGKGYVDVDVDVAVAMVCVVVCETFIRCDRYQTGSSLRVSSVSHVTP